MPTISYSAQCRRVLKPSGSLWVNLGDKYLTCEQRKRRCVSDAPTNTEPDRIGPR